MQASRGVWDHALPRKFEKTCIALECISCVFIEEKANIE